MHAAYKRGENVQMLARPADRIIATAPVRIVDIGGWTDTWFAGSGLVCNLAVGPAVTVEVLLRRVGGRPTLVLSDFGQSVVLDAKGAATLRSEHPVLAEILARHLNHDLNVERIAITSAVPPGSSLGTSASVGVAMIAALESAAGNEIDPMRIAELAHAAETGAGLQSGVQDHAAAAFGGMCEISVDYPSFSVKPVALSDAVKTQLNERLQTVFLGRHDSSSTHRMVIDRLESLGNPEACEELVQLRGAAAHAVKALRADDIDTYGKAMLLTVEAQRGLHPDLVSPASQRLVDLAIMYGGAAKVNGAGGVGGSVTLLGPADAGAMRSFVAELNELVARLPGASRVDLSLSDSGVTVLAR
jgi:D-glycero-alpha-D-manno-heptose-7-phosphate kinase